LENDLQVTESLKVCYKLPHERYFACASGKVMRIMKPWNTLIVVVAAKYLKERRTGVLDDTEQLLERDSLGIFFQEKQFTIVSASEKYKIICSFCNKKIVDILNVVNSNEH